MLLAGAAVWDAQRGPTPSAADPAQLAADVAALADKPHPMGSTAARRQRQRLTEALNELGLDVSIQQTQVTYQHPTRSGISPRVAWVENIVARLPANGDSKNSQTLLLMSHYDSVWQGPGAGDAASGVAAMLAAARVALAQPARSNHLVFLITDGEEMGLFGAQAFFRQHPLAPDIDLVLNFEARGNEGPPQMFQTSAGNAGLITMLSSVLGQPVANSLSYEVYRFMPNDTDMTISLAKGIPGLNFAFIGGFPNYHAATDSPEYLSQRSLQQQASQAEKLTAFLSSADLSFARAEHNRTYFNLSSYAFVHYPLTVAWLLMIVTAAAVIVGVHRVLSQRLLSWRSILAGLTAIIASVTMAISLFDSLGDLAMEGGWRSATFWRYFHLSTVYFLGAALITVGGVFWLGRRLAHGLPWTWLTAIAVVVVGAGYLADRLVFSAIGVAVSLLLLLPARRGLPQLAWLAAGALLWLLVGISLLVTLPHASYLAVLLALPAGVLLGLARPTPDGEALPSWPALLWIPAVAVFPPMAYLVFLGLGTFQPELALGLVALLTACTIVPLMARRSPFSTALISAGLAIGATATLTFAFTPAQRQPSDLFAVTDTQTGTTTWGSRDPAMPQWAIDRLGPAQLTPLDRLLPGRSGSWWQSEPFQTDAGPDAGKDAGFTATAAGNEVSLEAIADAPAARLYFYPRDNVAQVSVDGQRLETTEPAALRLFAMPQGTRVSVRAKPDTDLRVTWQTAQPGLPPGAPARPANQMATPGTWSDTHITLGEAQLGQPQASDQ